VLVAFDGIDSSGKATQTKRLVERLRYQGAQVRELATPDYATPQGAHLKKLLQDHAAWDALSWEEKMKLFADNRREHRDEVLAALTAGEIVVYDRYVPSSLAFITVEARHMTDTERAHIHRAIEKLEYEDNGMPHEHVSIFLDVPPRISGALLDRRKQERADQAEYTDHQHVQEQLYNEYVLMCDQQPKRFLRVPCVSGTELLGVEDVEEMVWEGLKERLPQLKTPSDSPLSGGEDSKRTPPLIRRGWEGF
jgi:dTMP kinase